MGRMTIENQQRYDEQGPTDRCFYCDSGKVRGYDYTPSLDSLLPGERGVRVRACVNCLPRIHYHVVTKGRALTLNEKCAILSPRRVVQAPQVQKSAFSVRSGILVPSDMSCFNDAEGNPAQYFTMSEHGPKEPVNVADLEAAQLCIGATLLGIRSDIVEAAWQKLAETVSHDVIATLQRRLI